MAWDDDRDRVEAYGMGDCADTCAVFAQFGKVAVTDEPCLISMCQLIQLPPYLLLEVGAEEQEVIP